MSNDKNRVGVEEEYQYPNDEYVSVQDADAVEDGGPEMASDEFVHEKPQNSLMGFVSRNRRVVGVTLAAVTLLVAFKVINHMNQNKIVMKAEPVAEQPAPVQATMSPEVANALSSIKRGSQETGSAVSRLQGQVSTLQRELAQAHRSQTALNQSVLAMSAQLKKLNERLSKPAPAIVKKGPPAPTVTYDVRALVEGRAWLVGSNGLSTSVKVGDPLPNYGMIRVIDPVRGVIITSSGKKIYYGSNDA